MQCGTEYEARISRQLDFSIWEEGTRKWTKKLIFEQHLAISSFFFFRSISLTVSSLRDLDLGKIILGTQCMVEY
jgi:hypothetical protein